MYHMDPYAAPPMYAPGAVGAEEQRYSNGSRHSGPLASNHRASAASRVSRASQGSVNRAYHGASSPVYGGSPVMLQAGQPAIAPPPIVLQAPPQQHLAVQPMNPMQPYFDGKKWRYPGGKPGKMKKAGKGLAAVGAAGIEAANNYYHMKHQHKVQKSHMKWQRKKAAAGLGLVLGIILIILAIIIIAWAPWEDRR